LQEEEEGIGDVDLFTLTEDRNKLVVNVKWLQHLQACTCSQDILVDMNILVLFCMFEAIANANCTLKTLLTRIQVVFVIPPASRVANLFRCQRMLPATLLRNSLVKCLMQ